MVDLWRIEYDFWWVVIGVGIVFGLAQATERCAWVIGGPHVFGVMSHALVVAYKQFAHFLRILLNFSKTIMSIF